MTRPPVRPPILRTLPSRVDHVADAPRSAHDLAPDAGPGAAAELERLAEELERLEEVGDASSASDASIAVADAPRPEASARAEDVAAPVTASEPSPISERPDRPRPAAKTPPAKTGKAAPRRPGGRRRFTLPALDEDHEKVSRSIETFLTGADAIPIDPPAASSAAATAAGPAGVGPTPSTVVTVSTLTVVDVPPGSIAAVRSTVEHRVRSTARGSDRVLVDRHGRIRLILPGSGELAAHASMRRIRAILEPELEAIAPGARLVFATATNLDGSVESARRRADRRLGAAIAAAGRAVPAADTEDADSEHDSVEPRAAGD
jgi:hypothetical protein